MKILTSFINIYLIVLIATINVLVSCKKEDNVNSAIESIKIGNSIWMKKNLDVAFYRNGDPIPQVTNMGTWQNLTTGAWTYYNNDPALGSKYGKLYNWYAVNDPRGLAPNGWHVATDNDWWNLVTNLGGITDAGGKLKSTGTSDWLSPNTGATNSSGFTALPGGYAGGAYFRIGEYGMWWTSKEENTTQAIHWILTNVQTGVFSGTAGKSQFLSVRCVKD